jgi:hypothetical protein
MKRSEDIQVGDRLITSRLRRRLPQRPYGRDGDSCEQAESRPVPFVEVLPAVQPSRVEEVLVVAIGADSGPAKNITLLVGQDPAMKLSLMFLPSVFSWLVLQTTVQRLLPIGPMRAGSHFDSLRLLGLHHPTVGAACGLLSLRLFG